MFFGGGEMCFEECCCVLFFFGCDCVEDFGVLCGDVCGVE